MTRIVNLLLMVMQKGLRRQWSFSGLATMVRITLMYYADFYSLSNTPEKDREIHLGKASEPRRSHSSSAEGACNKKNQVLPPCNQQQSPISLRPSIFFGQQ